MRISDWSSDVCSSDLKRVLKYLLHLVCVVIGVVVLAAGYVFYASNQRIGKVYAVPPPPLEVASSDQAAIERGRYLAHRVSLCVECHGEAPGGREEERSVGNERGSTFKSRCRQN